MHHDDASSLQKACGLPQQCRSNQPQSISHSSIHVQICRPSSAGPCLGSACVERRDNKPAASETAVCACAATEVLVGDFLNPFRRFAVWTKVRPSFSTP